jgi:hypothetical protein
MLFFLGVLEHFCKVRNYGRKCKGAAVFLSQAEIDNIVKAFFSQQQHKLKMARYNALHPRDGPAKAYDAYGFNNAAGFIRLIDVEERQNDEFDQAFTEFENLSSSYVTAGKVLKVR